MYTNRPTFAWIDLDALEHNYRVLRRRVRLASLER